MSNEFKLDIEFKMKAVWRDPTNDILTHIEIERALLLVENQIKERIEKERNKLIHMYNKLEETQ